MLDQQIRRVCNELGSRGALAHPRSTKNLIDRLYAMRKSVEQRPVTKLEAYDYASSALQAVQILTGAYIELSSESLDRSPRPG
jgi:hypothetical protein